MAYMVQELCQPETVARITAARESAEQYLQNIFAEIGVLQNSSNFLDAVDEVQARSEDLDTWKVQREQLAAVEACAKTCTCDEGAKLVLAEYSALAQAQGETAGLVPVYILPMPMWPSVIIIFSAFAGFVLAAYLSHKKSRPEPMVCPLKGDCAAVIRSEFSSFFGMGVEKIGMAYYLLVAVAYGIFLALPQLYTPAVIFIAVGVSMAAFLFSVYLTFIQLGFLKEICTWCLLSAVLSTVIFVTSVIGSDFAFVQFLSDWQTLIVLVYLIGLALGAGGATFSDVFFIKFLKDLKISHEEAGVLRTVSQVLWLGLGLVVISGVGLYFITAAAAYPSNQFLAGAVAVAVIVVNGAFLNLKVAPHLVHIFFGDDPRKTPVEELRRERRVAFGLSAISLISWYSLLVLTAWTGIPFPVSVILLVYLILLIAAVAAGQVLERHFGKKIMIS